MTGRDMIMLILQNRLEDADVLIDLSTLGLYTIEQDAVKLEVGVRSIEVMCALNELKSIIVDGKKYIYIEE